MYIQCGGERVPSQGKGKEERGGGCGCTCMEKQSMDKHKPLGVHIPATPRKSFCFFFCNCRYLLAACWTESRVGQKVR